MKRFHFHQKAISSALLLSLLLFLNPGVSSADDGRVKKPCCPRLEGDQNDRSDTGFIESQFTGNEGQGETVPLAAGHRAGPGGRGRGHLFPGE